MVIMVDLTERVSVQPPLDFLLLVGDQAVGAWRAGVDNRAFEVTATREDAEKAEQVTHGKCRSYPMPWGLEWDMTIPYDMEALKAKASVIGWMDTMNEFDRGIVEGLRSIGLKLVRETRSETGIVGALKPLRWRDRKESQ